MTQHANDPNMLQISAVTLGTSCGSWKMWLFDMLVFVGDT